MALPIGETPHLKDEDAIRFDKKIADGLREKYILNRGFYFEWSWTTDAVVDFFRKIKLKRKIKRILKNVDKN